MRARLTVEEKILIIRIYMKYESFIAVRRQWKKHLSTEPPTELTIQRVVNKFEDTGSVNERERTGRPRSVLSNEKVQEVKNLLENNPQLSIRAGCLEAEISRASFQRAIMESGFRPFRPHHVVELSDDDLDRREEFCSTFLAMIEQNPALLDKIIWSDESKFMLSGVINRHNCIYWAYSNPHQTIPVSNSCLGVMVWCGITSSGIIGPYFFDQNVTAESYLAMLKDFLWPQVKTRRMLFQQDGASAHYAAVVRNWLDEKFPNRWIGRRGPIEWPARSPDLSPPDFFLWGYLKDIVYRDRPATIQQLRDRITQACAEIPVEVCQKACRSVLERFKACRDAGGKQQI